MKQLRHIESEAELGPPEVAKVLEVDYSKAKRLMETNEIRSWVDTNASDGRRYLKTLYREVLAYHDRKLEMRDLEIVKPTQNKVLQRKKETSKLSNKTVAEFLRTEIFTS